MGFFYKVITIESYVLYISTTFVWKKNNFGQKSYNKEQKAIIIGQRKKRKDDYRNEYYKI